MPEPASAVSVDVFQQAACLTVIPSDNKLLTPVRQISDLSPGDMPDNLSGNILAFYRSKMPAINAIRVASDDVNLPFLVIDLLYLLDHQPIEFVLKHDPIPRFNSSQKEGDRSHNYVIPFPI